MLPGQQKTLLVAVAVNVLPYDFSTGVDIIKIGGNGARKIDVGKNPIAPQKAVIVAVAVDGAPYDVASGIDREATKRLCGSWDINSGEGSFAEEKTVAVTAAVYIETDDAPCGLIPSTSVRVAPGLAIGIKTPLLSRKL